MFGINPSQRQILVDILARQLNKNADVIIYGSRVKGTYTNRSDVDLALKNTQFNRHQLSSLIDEIQQSNFPYLCDIQLLENINNPHLKDHINRLGQVFYSAK